MHVPARLQPTTANFAEQRDSPLTSCMMWWGSSCSAGARPALTACAGLAAKTIDRIGRVISTAADGTTLNPIPHHTLQIN